MRPESVTWVPSPVAYASRNAVSFAFAAVFLTAAKALGRRSAMRASFMVVRPARYALRKMSSRARHSTWKMCRQPNLQTSQSYAQNSQREGRGSKNVCRSEMCLAIDEFFALLGTIFWELQVSLASGL